MREKIALKRKTLKRGLNPLMTHKNYRNELFNSLNHNNFNLDHLHTEDQITVDKQKIFYNEIEQEASLKMSEESKMQSVKGRVKFYVYQDQEVFQDFTIRIQKNFSPDNVLRDPLTGLWNRVFFEEEIKRLNTKRQLPLSIVTVSYTPLTLPTIYAV